MALPKGDRQVQAEAVAQAIGEWDTHNGMTLLVSTGLWRAFREALNEPVSGKRVSPQVSAALLRIVKSGALGNSACFSLFRFRFAIDVIQANAEGSEVSAAQLALLWEQLEALPQENVSNTTALACLEVASDWRGTYQEPNQTAMVGLKIDYPEGATFVKNTVRHEIGHALHAQFFGIVNPWLDTLWDYCSIDDNDKIWAWCKAIDPGLTENNKKSILEIIIGYIENGQGSFEYPFLDYIADSYRGECHAAISPVLQRALTESGVGYWNWNAFHQSDGRYYFINNYYGALCSFARPVADMVTDTNRPAAAFFHYEFFAECYAEYTETPENPGGNLPDAMAAVVARVIEASQRQRG